MKIRVQLKTGEMETITLVPPVEIHEREDLKMTHFSCGDGTDHYFWADTGHYDGWGRGVCGEAEGIETIESMESSREIDPTEPHP